MVAGYGDSYTVWCSPTPGTTEWPFSMRDGYIDQQFIKARYSLNGVWYPIKLAARNFKDAFTLTIVPALPPCQMVDIYRDTPKDTPIVNYGYGNRLFTGDSRNAAARQAAHVVAELIDLAHRQDLMCRCECLEAGGELANS